MSDIKSKDLLQAKVLGCLDPDEEALFSKMMNDDQDFPWEDLGKFQNLVSYLPILLDEEVPDQEVKDNIARKLLELAELKKADEVTEEIPDENTEKISPEIETSDESDVIVEDENIELEIPADESAAEEVVKKDISFKEHGILQGSLENNSNVPSQSVIVNEDKAETSSKKEQARTNVRSHISKSPAYIEPKVKTENNKATITAIILFIIAVIAITVVYFKLSADIQDNRDEIDRLKGEPVSGIYFDHSVLKDIRLS